MIILLSFLLAFLSSFSYYQLLWAILLLVIFYCYRFYNNNQWKKLGVPYIIPLPLVGNDLDLVLGHKTLQESQRVKYDRFGDAKFGGLYSMSSPVLFVKDTGLIESILIKDFSHFTDRGLPLNEKRDPLTAHLFNLTGKKWKGLRNKLSPVFTSGKLKTMHQQLIDCSDILLDVLNTSAETGEAVDFKETMAKFTTDVIGSCAYGLNMNSLRDPDNEFRKMGRRIFKLTVASKIRNVTRQILRSIHPELNYFFKLPLIASDINNFFINLVHNTIKLREENPAFMRNDFIQLIMNLRGKEKSISSDLSTSNRKESEITSEQDSKDEVYVTDNMLAANSFLFFVAGFETTASTLSYCLFELSHYPDIQEKLHDEVTEVLSKHGGQPTYEAIKNLPFMDSVISETLRKYPPVPLLFRICTESYRIPDTDVVIPKGCKLHIPVYSIHHDPNIFPEPERFVPQRFSLENKDSIPKGAYLPFGDGPRICIGARFAQMEIKVCLCKILTKYRIVKNALTTKTIEFDPKASFLLVPKGKIIMNIQLR